MAKISPVELERLKTQISLQRLVGTAGVVLKPRGEDWIGLCPFHDDHDPSLVINPGQEPLALSRCLSA
jgi:DNA primase